MSQRWFVHNDMDILTGWDRPTGRFFFSAFNLNAPDDEDDIIFSSEFSYVSSLNSHLLVQELNSLGVKTPLGLEKDLEEDRINDVGNLIYRYPN